MNQFNGTNPKRGSMNKLKWAVIHSSLFAISLYFVFEMFPMARINGDAMNFFSKFPNLDMRNTDFVPALSSFWDYLVSFYTGQNGRLAVGLMMSALWSTTQFLGYNAETVPVHFLIAFSFYCIVVSPIIIIFSLKNLLNRSLSYTKIYTLSALAIIYFILTPSIYRYAVFFSTYSVQYAMPLLLTALLLLKISKNPQFSTKDLILDCLMIIFIQLILEQTLVATPVIYMGYRVYQALHRSDLKNDLIKISSVVLFCYIASFCIFLLSPAQIYRMSITVGDGITLQGISVWISQLLGVIFEEGFRKAVPFFSLGKAVWSLFFGLSFIVCGFQIFKIRNFLFKFDVANLTQDDKTKILQFFSGLAFLACMSINLATPYLPEWALVYPMFLSLIYLNLTALIFYKYYSYKFNQFRYLKKVFISLVILSFTFSSYTSYNENKQWTVALNKMDELRYHLYRWALESYKTNPNSDMIFMDFPKTPFGWYIEPPWGFEAFFREKLDNKDIVRAGINEELVYLPKLNQTTAVRLNFNDFIIWLNKGN